MENKVLAVAAGYEITEKDLNSVINRYPQDKRAMFQSEGGKKQLLEQLIAFELMNKFAKEIELDKTQEYKSQMAAIEKEVLTSMAINKALADITVTDEEAKKFYDENKEAFAQPATVSAKHILVADEDEAKKIKVEIENKEVTFEEAAKKYSTCPSKEQGGNLGAFSRGMMVPEFEEAAFNAEIGVVTEPVKTQFGYHLVLVESKDEASSKSFEEVKDSVINQLLQENQHKKYNDLLGELENKYGVKRN